MSTGTELLTSITDLQRQINCLQAQQLERIATFADVTASARGAPKELSMALHTMPQHAANQITFARDLVTRLPRERVARPNGRRNWPAIHAAAERELRRRLRRKAG